MRKLHHQPTLAGRPARAAVVVPNGTLFGDGVCARIKEELLKDFNLHTIVRLPNGVFAPYTSIPTNLLFFDRSGSRKRSGTTSIRSPRAARTTPRPRRSSSTNSRPVSRGGASARKTSGRGRCLWRSCWRPGATLTARIRTASRTLPPAAGAACGVYSRQGKAHCRDRRANSGAAGRVVTVSRKALGIEHPKLRPLITDFDAIETAIAGLGERVDDAFCALGTTIKTAGSRDAFRRVDFGYVVAFARATRAAGARQFMFVSAIGADAVSAFFYLRVKGETEEAVAALGYPVLHIFRPGLLLGRRTESRPRESLGMVLAPFFNPLMLGPAKAYRGIPADTVAAAMIAAAARERTGRHIHTYADMVAPAGFDR